MATHIREFAHFCSLNAGPQTVVFVKATDYESASLRDAFDEKKFKYHSVKHWVKDAKSSENFDFKMGDIEFDPGTFLLHLAHLQWDSLTSSHHFLTESTKVVTKITASLHPGSFKQTVEVSLLVNYLVSLSLTACCDRA